ncbi:MAG: hypothetical protein A2171_01480 [Candidatus Levybacteria bacterium RBG_13_35_9]|nr:MAG: hypothetical protein A2171_01480 [Candidatus Levybacteria bacterium RBG_13_35_9]
MKNNLIIGVIVALILGGVSGFLGGVQYQKSQQPQIGALNRQFGQTGSGTFRQGQFQRNGMIPVSGEIIDADDKSITIKLEDGSSKIVLISDDTMINKASEGSKEDLKTGEMVAAFGITNSDGSVTAQSIQLNPQVRIFQRTSPTPNP